MARSSVMVTMDIAMTEASNTTNQNELNRCSAKLEELQGRIEELDGKKKILESAYLVYSDLKGYMEEHLSSLEETSVCITEIKAESTEQIGSKIDTALRILEGLVNQITSTITATNTEYNTTYGEMQTYKTNLANGKQKLGALKNELMQAKEEEMPKM